MLKGSREYLWNKEKITKEVKRNYSSIHRSLNPPLHCLEGCWAAVTATELRISLWVVKQGLRSAGFSFLLFKSFVETFDCFILRKERADSLLSMYLFIWITSRNIILRFIFFKKWISSLRLWNTEGEPHELGTHWSRPYVYQLRSSKDYGLFSLCCGLRNIGLPFHLPYMSSSA